MYENMPTSIDLAVHVERLQTLALDRSATGIGYCCCLLFYMGVKLGRSH
jgi:hypothetical protein